MDHLVSSGPLDQLAKRENLVSQDFLDILDGKAQRDPLDSQDSLVQTARRAQGVWVEKQGQEDNVDQRVHEVKEDHEVQLASQEQREHQEVMVLQAHQERGDCQDLREPMVSLDPKAPLDLQERTDCPGTLDREEKLVSKAKWVHLGLLVSLDLRGHLERPAQWASVATPDHQDHLGSKGFLVHQERRALRVILALLEVLAKTVHLD